MTLTIKFITVVTLMLVLPLSVSALRYSPYNECLKKDPRSGYLDQDEIYKEYKASIFRIKTKSSNETFATATLISDDGLFLTAAHIFQFYDASQLKIVPYSRKLRQQYFEIKLLDSGTPGDSIKNTKNDWAIFQAVDWPQTGINGIRPARLRYSVLTPEEESSGFFAGFPVSTNYDNELDSELTKVAFKPATFNKFRGQVFKGMSGSLLIDKNGWGFGVVGAHGEPEITKMSLSDKRRWFADANNFSAAKFEAADNWWKFVDPDKTYPLLQQSYKELVASLFSASPIERENAFDDLAMEFNDLDFIKLEYLIDKLKKVEINTWEVENIYNLIGFIMANSVKRCMKVSDRFRPTNMLNANLSIELGRAVYSLILKNSNNFGNYENLKFAEKLLDRGKKILEQRPNWALNNGVESKFQSNLVGDLSMIQAKLVKLGDENALERALENYKLARTLYAKNPMHFNTGIKIAKVTKDYESEARYSIDRIKHIQSLRNPTASEITSLQTDVNYLANVDAQKGGAWGTNVIESSSGVDDIQWASDDVDIFMPTVSADLPPSPMIN